jgi:very-short-patch-repair endonuclease/DNA polymerase III delta prime subunit
MDADTLRVARDKLTRVFRYLEALNQHRNPAKKQIRDQIWTLWLKDLPDHPSIRRGALRQRDAAETLETKTGVSGVTQPEEQAFILKVNRPRLTTPPPPPKELESWLERGWDDPSKETAVRATQNEPDEHGQTRIVNFHGDPKRLSAFETWRQQHDAWAKNERPARASMKIFEAFYELYGRLDREAERVELVLGDGILSWRRAEGGIYHPVLLQRLQLEFNANVPEFTLAETEVPVELYSALFQSMSDVDGRAIGRCREELEQGSFHPLGDDSTSGFLRRLVIQLSPRGEFSELGAPSGEKDDPQVGRGAVVFLRNRTLGFAAAIEGVLADLRTREDLPWSLLNIVGEESPLPEQDEVQTASVPLLHTENDVLLSKPANPEQIRIAKQLSEHGGVLVQGPPGTGKTHTIANLIGHLLAQGKSVLITSHTTKALRMVRHHVVEELRPLCVSVLESDLESRNQLESSVGSIAERLSRADSSALEAEANRLEAERRVLLDKMEEIRTQLIEARSDEYRDIVLAGKAWSPADAARKVSAEQNSNGWVPGPASPGAPLPISMGDLIDLYHTNTSVGRQQEIELSGSLPDPSEIPNPEDFRAILTERERLNKEDLSVGSQFWQADSPPDPKRIEALTAKLVSAVEPLLGKEKWKLDAVYAGKYGGAYRHPWDQLLNSIRLVHTEGARVQEALLKLAPQPALTHTLEDQERIAAEILAHIEQDGEPGFFTFLTHRSWKAFVDGSKVNGKIPTQREHFEALRTSTHMRILRRDLATRWDRQVAVGGSNSSHGMGSEPERTLIQFCNPIANCLAWHEKTWLPLEKELKEIGFLWDKFMSEQPVVVGPTGEVTRLAKTVGGPLPAILSARFNRIKLQQIESSVQELRRRLENLSASSPASRVTADLASATSAADPKAYLHAFGVLADLRSRSDDLSRRNELLKKLETTAPSWAAAVRNRSGQHGREQPPGDPEAAWVWRQLVEELDRRGSISLEQLQAKNDNLREQLRHVTVDLIDRRAWAFQAKRTTSRQRQALIGWLDTIRRIGKGTGIRVPMLRAEAAKKMRECRSAVPVWVMPLSRVVENFDPQSARFDVVIIDEASQSDVMALMALYLGKTVLVVGDHEQVSPTAVGQDLGIIQNLIFEHLQGIPNSHLYDGQISIYDLARQSFGGTTCLVEHFRCAPEIIQFSNKIAYEGRIKPLRDTSTVILRPHTISYRVQGASRDGKVNAQEALAVASLICAAIEQPEYGKSRTSFGVVSLLGEEQAIEIERMLRNHLPPNTYERHRILCGNAAQFQGDERDVVFLSMVDTAERGPLSLRDRQLFKQRFNVAASRARDQMWLVHSLNAQTDLKADDLRRQLIEHVEDPSHLMRVLEEKTKRTESIFEREVLKRLVLAGYRVTPQWRVGAYRIDLVVEANDKRLAVECDGDRYHPLDKLGEDMERQSILERMGWIFTRVRGSEFFRNADRALAPVFSKLESLEILPLGEDTNNHLGPSSELTDRVIRRAEELRVSWCSGASN